MKPLIYPSLICKMEKPLQALNLKEAWQKMRLKFLNRDNYTCAYCNLLENTKLSITLMATQRITAMRTFK